MILYTGHIRIITIWSKQVIKLIAFVCILKEILQSDLEGKAKDRLAE